MSKYILNPYAILSLLFLLLLLLPTGCGSSTEVAEAPENPFGEMEPENLMLLGYDMSLSCAGTMTDNGAAWELSCRAIDTYLTRGGPNARIIVMQMSGNDRPLLYDGEVHAFRARFNADSFRQLLRDKSIPEASRIHDSLNEAIRYVLFQDHVRPQNGSKPCRVSVVICTDMEDNASQPEGKAKLQATLKELAKCNAVLGLYGVEANLATEWAEFLTATGIRHKVSADIRDNAPLPKFE